MSRRPRQLPEPARRTSRRWAAAWGLAATALVGSGWGGWEWSTFRCLSQARDLIDRDPAAAEEVAARATGAWSWQRDTAWVVRGRCLLATRELPEACGCWSFVSAPQRVPTADLLEFAAAAASAGDLPLAELVLAAADRPGEYRQAWLTKSLQLAIVNQRWDRVAAWSDELSPLAAESGPAWHAVAEARRSLGQFPAASAAYRHAWVADAPPVDAATRTAIRDQWSQLLLDLGEFSAAEPLIAETLAEHPTDPAALRRQAAVLRSRGAFDAALEQVAAARRTAPADLRVQLLTAAILSDLGRGEDARHILEPLIASHPYLPEPRHRLAQILRQTGETERAVAEESRAQALSRHQRELLDQQSAWRRRRDPSTARRIGELLRELGREIDAQEWDRAVSINSGR